MKGFTIIEMIVVLALISLFSVMLVPQASRMITQSRINSSRVSASMVATAIYAYYKTAYDASPAQVIPLESTSDPVRFLISRSFLSTEPLDGWGFPFKVHVYSRKIKSRAGISGGTSADVYGGEYTVTIISAGSDRTFGSADDIEYSESRKTF